MTILQSLSSYYDRLAGQRSASTGQPLVPPPGYSAQEIGYYIVIARDGCLIEVQSFGPKTRNRPTTRALLVPAPVTEPSARTASALVPYFLWDKPSYLIGLALEGEKRADEKYRASRAFHLKLLAEASDPVLVAVRSFFERHEKGVPAGDVPTDYLDRPYVIKLDGDLRWAHEVDEARNIWLGHLGTVAADAAVCLITGAEGPIARLHPKISGFRDADSLVSFNEKAFESYGRLQGANAPVSIDAAFRYGAALDYLTGHATRQRIQIGDAAVVFWADASGAGGEPAAQAAEELIGTIFEPPAVEDAEEAATLARDLEAVAKGRPIAELRPGINPGTRIHVLGLSPNAARLSVRFWLTDSIDALARRLATHFADLAIDPLPWRSPPSINRLLVKTTALKESFDNIPPLLAGEVMRAVLEGGRYPRALLGAAIMRLRAGDDPGSGWHAAVIRACINRSEKEKVPVSLERDREDTAYQLGRLFAALESAQRAALGKVNATIRDRYFGAASATPAGVFPLLIKGVQNHLAKLRKDGKGGWLEREIEEIAGHLPPELPRALRLQEQGRFAIGYYHQRKARFAVPEAVALEEEESENDGN